MIVPTALASFKEALRAGSEIYHALRKSLAAMNMTVAVGDEGGFAPRLKDHEAALDVLSAAVREAQYGGSVRVALDAAASEFYRDGGYFFERQPRTASQMTDIYEDWLKRYGLVSLEDPLAEDDWAGWKALTARLGERARVIGDDLFVTNPARLKRGIGGKGVGNAVLIKLNQIGTVTETVETVLMAQKAGYSCVISHRSGETEDPYIADLAVALNAGAIKTGAPAVPSGLRQVQPAPAHRGRAGPQGPLCGRRLLLRRRESRGEVSR